MKKKLIHSTIWVMLLTGLLAFSIIHPMTATEISDDSSKDTAIEDADAWRIDGSYDSVYNGIRVSSEMKEKVKKQETEKEIKETKEKLVSYVNNVDNETLDIQEIFGYFEEPYTAYEILGQLSPAEISLMASKLSADNYYAYEKLMIYYFKGYCDFENEITSDLDGKKDIVNKSLNNLLELKSYESTEITEDEIKQGEALAYQYVIRNASEENKEQKGISDAASFESGLDSYEKMFITNCSQLKDKNENSVDKITVYENAYTLFGWTYTGGNGITVPVVDGKDAERNTDIANTGVDDNTEKTNKEDQAESNTNTADNNDSSLNEGEASKDEVNNSDNQTATGEENDKYYEDSLIDGVDPAPKYEEKTPIDAEENEKTEYTNYIDKVDGFDFYSTDPYDTVSLKYDDYENVHQYLPSSMKVTMLNGTQEEIAVSWIETSNKENEKGGTDYTYEVSLPYNYLFSDELNAAFDKGEAVKPFVKVSVEKKKTVIRKAVNKIASFFNGEQEDNAEKIAVYDADGERTIEDGEYYLRCNAIEHYAVGGLSRNGNSGEEIGSLILCDNIVDKSYTKFKITYVGSGYYTISLGYSGYVMTVKDSDSGEAATLISDEYQGGKDNELWKIKKNDDGTYAIQSKLGNYWRGDGPLGGKVRMTTDITSSSNVDRTKWLIYNYDEKIPLGDANGAIKIKNAKYIYDANGIKMYLNIAGSNKISSFYGATSGSSSSASKGDYTIDGEKFNYYMYVKLSSRGTFVTDYYYVPYTGSNTYLSGLAGYNGDDLQFSKITIYKVNATNFAVYCKVTGNSSLPTMVFPTWTSKNGQDDLTWYTGQKGTFNYDGETYNYAMRINIANHKNETGFYNMHVYDNARSRFYVGIGITFDPVKQWTIDGSNGTATIYDDGTFTISTNNSAANYYDGKESSLDNIPWKDYRDKIKKVYYHVYGSTANMDSYAGWFYGCENLESINQDFWNTFKKTKDTSYMFYGCKNLQMPEEMKLPDTLEKADSMFEESSLTAMTDKIMPNGSNLISARRMYANTKVTNLPDNFKFGDNMKYANEMFENTPLEELPSGFEFNNLININGLLANTNLSSLPAKLKIPDTVESMDSLLEMTDKPGITSIPEGFTIGKNVQTMQRAFANNPSLTVIPSTFNIPDGADALNAFWVNTPVDTENKSIDQNTVDYPWAGDNRIVGESSIVNEWEIGKDVKSDVVARLYNDGKFTITGKGDTITFKAEDDVPWKEQVANITSVYMDKKVTPGNMDFWFENAVNLESLGNKFKIPDSVESAIRCFYNCPKLTVLESTFSMPEAVLTMKDTDRPVGNGNHPEIFYTNQETPLIVKSKDKNVKKYNLLLDNRKSSGKITYDLNGGSYVSDATDTTETAYDVTFTPFVAQKGIEYTDKGTKYKKTDGTYAKNEIIISDSKGYYYNAEGILTTGWQTINGAKYYFDATEGMYIGAHTIDGKEYFFALNGKMITNNWSDNKYYSADGTYDASKGNTAGSWIGHSTKNNCWWYRHSDGTYTSSGFEYINGKWYYFDASGWTVTGWQLVDNNWYYLQNSGDVTYGWLWVGSDCYYQNDIGIMVRSSWVQNGAYYVDENGLWVKNKTTAGATEGWTDSQKNVCGNDNSYLQGYKVSIDNNTDVTITSETYNVGPSSAAWSKNGNANQAGNINGSNRITAIKLNVSGFEPEYYTIKYRVYTDKGWSDYGENGEVVGTEDTDKSNFIRKVEVKLTKRASQEKDELMPGSYSYNEGLDLAEITNKTIDVSIKPHISNIGWASEVMNKAFCQNGYSLEAFQLSTKLDKNKLSIVSKAKDYSGSAIDKWIDQGATVGSVGNSNRIRGVCFELRGSEKEQYKLSYRIYTDATGWTQYVSEGTWCENNFASSGSEIRGLEIKLEKEAIIYKDGCQFNGWYLDKDCTQPITNIPVGSTEDYTLYAGWTEKENKIEYILNGGVNNPENPSSFTESNRKIEFKEPSKDGFTFDGWYLDEALNIPYTGEIPESYTGTVYLYAGWKNPPTRNISYELDGGTNNTLNPSSYVSGEKEITLQNPQKAGYYFRGWYLDPEFTQPITKITTDYNEDITLYAKFEAVAAGSVTISSFYLEDVSDGVSNLYARIENDSIYSYYECPTWSAEDNQWDEGAHWDRMTKGNYIINGITYNYKYTVNKSNYHGDYGPYNTHIYGCHNANSKGYINGYMSYMLYGGVGYTVKDQGDKCSNWICTHNVTFWDYSGGTDFTDPLGWRWHNHCGACSKGWDIYSPFHEQYLECSHYSKDVFGGAGSEMSFATHTYCSYNGGVSNKLWWCENYTSGTLGDGVDFWADTRTTRWLGGYGTYSPNTLWHHYVKFCADHKIANKYTVRYHANGGTGVMNDSTYSYGTGDTLLPNQFTRPGYKFVGWTLDKNSNTINYNDGHRIYNLSSKDGDVIDLYAVWRADATVTYDANGGSTNGASTYENIDVDSGSYSIRSNSDLDFTNGERQFAGWSLDPKSDTPDYIAEELPEDISTDEYFQLVEDQKVIENTQGIIPEGNYTLLTKENTTYGLNVQNGNNVGLNPGANIQLWTNSAAQNEQFKITRVNGDYYSIQSMLSGYYLTIEGDATKEGANVYQAEWTGADEQLWKFEKEDNFYRIQSKKGLYIGTADGEAKNQLNVQMTSDTSTDKVWWKANALNEFKNGIAEGYYTFATNVNGNYQWDIDNTNGIGMNPGSKLHLWQSSDDSLNHQYKITKVSGEYYSIQVVLSGYYLTVKGNSNKTGAGITQEQWTGEEGQLWKFTKYNHGYFIQSKLGTYIELKDGNAANMATIQMTNKNTRTQQLWMPTLLNPLKNGIYTISTSLDQSKKLGGLSCNYQISEGIGIAADDAPEATTQFRFTYLYSGYYRIELLYSNMVLDVPYGSTTNGNKLQTYTYNSSSNNQKWKLISAGDGTYYIRSAVGVELDLSNAKTNAGTPVILWQSADVGWHKWVFDRVDSDADNLTLYAVWDTDDRPVIKPIPDPDNPDNPSAGKDELTFYEGQTVTKADLTKNLMATDKKEGDITDKIRITKIQYADGKIVDGHKQKGETLKFDDDVPEGFTLDTWFMQLDKNDSPVKHKITYEVTNSDGKVGTYTQIVNVKYNEFPVINTEDRAYRLTDAKNGLITEDSLLKDSLESGETTVSDIEDDELVPGTLKDKLELVDFDSSVYTNLTGPGIFTQTYKLTDSMGKITYYEFNIYIMRDGEVFPEDENEAEWLNKLRFINKDFYELNKDAYKEDHSAAELQILNNNGGLNVESKWYTDPTYQSMIEEILSDDAVSESEKTYTNEQIKTIKQDVETNGFAK